MQAPRMIRGAGWVHNGYHKISVDGREVLAHIYIVEQKIGRRLRSKECVHHKNGDRQDNRLENLELMTRGEHTSLHKRAQRTQTN
jgi:hypothetical protein